MVSTRRATYEAPPPTPNRRRSLHQEAAEADAIPRGNLDSDMYWSGTGSWGNSASESAAVALSKGSASVLSGDSTKGWSIGSPEASSNSPAGGRIVPELSHSVVPCDLHHDAIPRTSSPSTAIGSSFSGVCDALDFVAVSSVKPEPDITSSSSIMIGLTSSRDETGLLPSCAQAQSAASASVPVAASSVPPAPDNSSVVTADDDRRVLVADTNSVSLPSFGPSANIIYRVPDDVVNQFVLPKRFARHVPDSENIFLDTSTRFFPLWFRQSIETGQDSTETRNSSDADFDSDMSSGVMVLYSPSSDEDEKPARASSKKAGKHRQKSGRRSRKSSQKASGNSAPKAPVARIPCLEVDTSIGKCLVPHRILPSSSSSSSSDSSSSSESSDSESSSSSNESSTNSAPHASASARASSKNKASKKRHEGRSKNLTKLLRSVKIKAPFVYDGSADFDKFEQWTYEVDTWIDFNSIPTRWAVRLIAAFVSGPASEYFMDFVATDHGSFKMKQIYSGLFEYCFPVEIRRNMRRDLLSARQHTDEKVRNFIRRVTRLSKRLGDVSDRQIVQIVWDGALSYLRLKWADAGFDFETSLLSALETAAKGYEVAETIRRIEAAKRAEAASAKSSGFQSSVKPPVSGVSSNTATKKLRLTQEERDQFTVASIVVRSDIPRTTVLRFMRLLLPRFVVELQLY
ncbi:DNA/RNA polymerase [Mycena venus]|uniref:DNA/RNA polymerase n=1 Tax=Mycena venus TaxID=2733690 RepID=A0A8H7CP33_9AGAR|nr:DNA/RNA polymerase [Mycena venus]